MSYPDISVSNRSWSPSPTVGGMGSRGSGSGMNGILGALGAGGGIAGLIASLFAPSENELAAGRSRERGAAEVSDFNRGLTETYNFDPNFAARNMLDARKMAFLLNNPNMQGESAAQRDPNGFGRLLETLNDPASQRLYANNQGGFDFRPASFTPTTLDDKGRMQNATAPNMAMPPPAQPTPQFRRPEEMFGIGRNQANS